VAHHEPRAAAPRGVTDQVPLDYEVTRADLEKAQQQYGGLPEFAREWERQAWRGKDTTAAAVEQRTGIRLPQHYHDADRQTGAFKKNGRRRPISKTKRQKVYERDGYRCVECGCDVLGYLSIDHKLPVSRGGSNKMSNLQTLCKTCNCRKADSPPS
jgi:5-methylcytosine-specific restriction enzyme A